MAITAGILAGGKSSRMGENKALLMWKGQTLLEHLAKLLASWQEGGRILVSVAGAEEYRSIKERWEEDTELVFVEDERLGYGPLEGLYQLLSHGKQDWMFIVAADMPLVNRELIQCMAGEAREDVQAVIPRAAGRVHPLCGLYAGSVLPVLERLLHQEEHRVSRLLQEIPVRYVDVEALGLDGSVLENANTPEEYRRIAEMCPPPKGEAAADCKDAPAAGEGSSGGLRKCSSCQRGRSENMRVAVITSSDSGAAGLREDKSGPLIEEIVTRLGGRVVSAQVLPDERQQLEEAMEKIADEGLAELILTTGGTGFSKRDCMPEATEAVSERRVPGIPEAMRSYSMQFTGRAMLSRAAAGIRKETLIVNLPGSPKAIEETLEYIYPHLVHGVEILTGAASDCARREGEPHHG